MKIKVIPTLISVFISALCAYAIYSFAATDTSKLLIAMGAFVCLSITLIGVIGFSLDNSRKAMNIHITSGVFNAIFFIVAIIYACVNDVNIPSYIIINGLLALVWILVVYGISKALQ